MNTRLYVGNLPFSTTEIDLEELFAQHGPVANVSLIVDRTTQRSRGFAFVTMQTAEDAQKALETLNGHAMDGRPMQVSEARPKAESSSPRSYGEGGGGGGGGGYRGGGSGEKRGGGGYREEKRSGRGSGGGYRERRREDQD